ncbi:MAG TPA: Rpn family recombination-promoting nuclease/putative transposase [Thermoanaerobaculia bacterium]|nr:Rpn family recombination-promoting nuclease/putative transposase [Thermoanaerobaculia bacterium]
MGQHDLSYRAFFVHRQMIQGLLQEILGDRWVERVDLDSGERVDTSVVSPKHENRESDIIWKFRRTDGGELASVYLFLEFQSRPDPSMPVRFMGYEGLFYQALGAGQPEAAWRNLPLIIPVVLYNGREPWHVATDLGSLIGDLDPSAEIYRPQLRYRLVEESAYTHEDLAKLKSPVAELFRIERSSDWTEVLECVDRLCESLPPSEAYLRQAFVTWLKKIVAPRFGKTQEMDAIQSLEDFRTMLAENIDRWNRELKEEGRQEGRQELLLLQLRRKFGPLEPEVEDRVLSADADRLLEWSQRILTAESLRDVLGD